MKGILSSLKSPKRFWGPNQPLVRLLSVAVSTGKRRPGREAKHPSSSAAVKNVWNHTSNRVMRWRSWLRLCATSREAEASNPDGVTGNPHLLNPCGHTVTLGPTQPLIEMSIRDTSWKAKAVAILPPPRAESV
jgi:hypothetical protein